MSRNGRVSPFEAASIQVKVEISSCFWSFLRVEVVWGIESEVPVSG